MWPAAQILNNIYNVFSYGKIRLVAAILNFLAPYWQGVWALALFDIEGWVGQLRLRRIGRGYVGQGDSGQAPGGSTCCIARIVLQGRPRYIMGEGPPIVHLQAASYYQISCKELS